MANPVAEIGKIARFLDCTPTGAEVAELVKLVGTAELGPTGHKYQPGAGKWLALLPPDRVQSIAASGLTELAARFGYTDMPTGTPGGGAYRPTVSPLSLMYYADIDDVRARLSEQYVIANVAGLPVAVRETGKEYLGQWEQRVASDHHLRHILRSCSLLNEAFGAEVR